MHPSFFAFRSRPRVNLPVSPSVQCVDYAVNALGEREYGCRLSGIAYAMYADHSTAILETEEDARRFAEALLERMQRDEEWLPGVVRWSEEHLNDLRNYARAFFRREQLRPLSNQEVARRYVEFHEFYRAFHLKNTPAWWLGSEILLEKLQLKPPTPLSGGLTILLCSPEYLTEQTLEEESLLRLSIEAAGIGSGWRKALAEKIRQHASEFSSIPFGYNTGVVWGEEEFVRRIEERLADPAFASDPDGVLRAFLHERTRLREERDALEDKLELSAEARHLLQCLRAVAYLQDLKKTAQTRSHPILVQEAHVEIAERLKLTPVEISYMDYAEVAACLEAGGVEDAHRAEIRRRLGTFTVAISRDLNVTWLTGAGAESWLRERGFLAEADGVTELKGTTANPGRARGRVCLARVSTEIHRMHEGDILVTAMTTPDFVPAMKIASAIVTDEGGVTCHAAIVSRELGKPCVIGTKIATQVLKDGDEVEVDAEKGVVKIIKRA